jgi:hypothetical protein
MSKKKTILVHLPAYREPELIPTIKDALDKAKYPDRIHFGICRQFHPDDDFDNVDEFRDRKGFKVMDVPYDQAKGLPWARARINEDLLDDEDYVLQLDSHHRFNQDWDDVIIKMHDGLKNDGVKKPLIGGYLPLYEPTTDPVGRADCPWQAQYACFYPHGTIFIRPGELPGWRDATKPIRARFLSGHFCFGDAQWARDVLHDPEIFFSGEELNLSVRSYTHGYDIYHSHKMLIWHATMRTERDGILVWDDKNKKGEDWWAHQITARAKIRQLLYGEDNGFDIKPEYGLGEERTVEDYENFAGLNFKNKLVQQYTIENKEPPNPDVSSNNPWRMSFYQSITLYRPDFKLDDYDFWHVAFDDENGNAVHYEQFDENRIAQYLSQPGHISWENFFSVEKMPTKWVVWAHSKSKEWAERFEGNIEGY